MASCVGLDLTAWLDGFGLALAQLVGLGLAWLIVRLDLAGCLLVWLSGLLWLALAWVEWFGFGLAWLLRLGLTWLVVCGLVWLAGFSCS